jgi:hypothetical protein
MQGAPGEPGLLLSYLSVADRAAVPTVALPSQCDVCGNDEAATAGV